MAEKLAGESRAPRYGASSSAASSWVQPRSGHDDASDLGAAYARRLLPDLDAAMVQRVLGRTSYASAQEREAEIVATLLGELIAAEASNPFPAFGADDPEASEGLIELFRALGGRGGG